MSPDVAANTGGVVSRSDILEPGFVPDLGIERVGRPFLGCVAQPTDSKWFTGFMRCQEDIPAERRLFLVSQGVYSPLKKRVNFA